MTFAIDILALALACAFCIAAAFFLKGHPEQPYLSFSHLADFNRSLSSWRQRYAKLPDILSYLALTFFLLAFIDPHLRLKSTRNPEAPLPTEGIAIYLLLDQSGSMKEVVNAILPSGETAQISKIDLLKEVTKSFVEGDPAHHLPGHPNDLIGLVEFARFPQVVSPLTLDHGTILDKISHFEAVKNTEDDGTAMGYAIYKTVNIIVATRHFAEELATQGKPAYTIKNAVIVVVTDGLQFPNPLDKGNRLRNIDLDEAAQYAKNNAVKVYLVNVDPDVVKNPDLEPQRHLMKRITEMTGGELYLLNDETSLSQIYGKIDQLEKSSLSEGDITKAPVQFYKRFSFYPYLLFLGLLCLATSIILRTTVLKRIP